MHPHQSWGGWDSHTSSRGHDLHSKSGRLGEERLGPSILPLGVKTQEPDWQGAGETGLL